MKSEEKSEKDPIKDKYNQKIGFFKKIKLKFLVIRDKLKNNKTLWEEIGAGSSIISGVALYGVLGGLALTLFGVGFSVSSVLSVGSLLWLVENKFVGIVTKILGSFKLVNIYN